MNENKLGKLISGKQKRDAVHIAIMPVIAAEHLLPGQKVGLVEEGNDQLVGSKTNKIIGVVDPFLEADIQKGEEFYLCVKPNTITSLRHEWVHPDIPAKEEGYDDRLEKEAQAKHDFVQKSKDWLAGFAADLGIDYEELMESGNNYLTSGDYWSLGNNTSERAYSDISEFWKHFEIVSEKKVKDYKAAYFTCSC